MKNRETTEYTEGTERHGKRWIEDELFSGIYDLHQRAFEVVFEWGDGVRA